MFAKAASAGFLSFVVLLFASLTPATGQSATAHAPLLAPASSAAVSTTGSNLTNPFYIEPRASTQHIALDSGWELSYP